METESQYSVRAKAAFARIEAAFDQVDVDVVDCERTTGDVITMLFANGVKCVINTQRPTQQIWVAANAQAWHFAWDEAAGVWVDAKRDDSELFDSLRRLVTTNSGVTLTF